MLDFGRECARMNSVNDNRRWFGVKNGAEATDFRGVKSTSCSFPRKIGQSIRNIRINGTKRFG